MFPFAGVDHNKSGHKSIVISLISINYKFSRFRMSYRLEVGVYIWRFSLHNGRNTFPVVSGERHLLSKFIVL